MNVKHYKKVLRQIKKHPETWNQTSWHSCETKHCFAGWAEMFYLKTLSETKARKMLVKCVTNDSGSRTSDHAILYLGLTTVQASYLFSMERTMEDFDNFLLDRTGW